MAKKTFKLLETAPQDWAKADDGVTALEPGTVFEADYGYDTEKALVAAGWVEVVEEKKGGKK